MSDCWRFSHSIFSFNLILLLLMKDPKKVKRYTWFVFLFLLFSQFTFAQELKWVYLPENSTNNSCTSSSSLQDSTACFGLTYFPSTTGSITSYTFGYLIECNDGSNSILNAESCSMIDNTVVFEDCAGSNTSFMIASGNDGSVAISAGDSIILHQVCVDLAAGDSISVELDVFTGVTISLDTPSGPVTDTPMTPSTVELIDTVYGLVDCAASKVCSFNFGSDEPRSSFVLNGNDNIMDASSDTLLINTLMFDFYDELNEICQLPGGENDVTVTMELLTTDDQYGNAFLDTLAGSGHRIKQESDGLLVELPFNMGLDSESSTSDIRGVSFKVDFELHIGIYADQISVDILDANSKGEIFESAAVIFYDAYDIPYDTVIYNGFYQDSTDLSGLCNFITIGNAWSTTGDGIGSFFLDSLNRVNVNAPCNPVEGVSTNDTISVRAVEDAGLDPMDIIGGFEVIVMGEDVAAPSSRDDGSEMDGDDDIASNLPTSTTGVLTSKFAGYSVDGCVFNPVILPVNFIEFKLRKENGFPHLTWKTTDHIDHSHFEVEWSKTGRDFQKIGEVIESSFLEQVIHSYEFTHEENKSSGIQYYRIKQVDVNGAYEYTEVKTITLDNETNAHFDIFPNPSDGFFNITFDQVIESDKEVKIYSVQGQLLKEQIMNKGVQQISLDLAELPKGSYFIRINNTVKRMVKM